MYYVSARVRCVSLLSMRCTRSAVDRTVNRATDAVRVRCLVTVIHVRVYRLCSLRRLSQGIMRGRGDRWCMILRRLSERECAIMSNEQLSVSRAPRPTARQPSRVPAVRTLHACSHKSTVPSPWCVSQRWVHSRAAARRPRMCVHTLRPPPDDAIALDRGCSPRRPVPGPRVCVPR